MPSAARDLLVWLHVVTSVGWMSQALALFALVVYGAAIEGQQRAAAFTMAELLDQRVLL